MLKKVLLLAVLFVLPLTMMAQSKFGHINSQEIITLMPEFKKAQTDLDAMGKKYQQEMERTQNELTKKYQEFMAERDSLPKNIAERRQKELQDMAQRQEQFQQEAQQSMQKAQQDALQPILKKVNDAVQAIGKKENMTFVFDLSQVPIAYVGADAVDLTAKVKEALGIK